MHLQHDKWDNVLFQASSLPLLCVRAEQVWLCLEATAASLLGDSVRRLEPRKGSLLKAYADWSVLSSSAC
jgi:hypothetical protein